MDTDDHPVLGGVAPERRGEIETHVEELLSELDLEAKIGQLNQVNASFATGTPVGEMDIEEGVRDGTIGSILNVEGLDDAREYQRIAVEESDHGIPIMLALDVVHGHRTIFPIPLGEAATFDPGAAERSARVAAREASADGIHWTFAPSVDVTRDPRWGRVMEAAGEDPYLGSEFARARVQGYQGEDLTDDDTVLACAKHYVGYGASEAGREYNTVSISETELRELHLPPFEAAVDAGVGSVMNSFNVHERIPASGSEFLVDELLRGELGFDDLVVSDWNSFGELIEHGVASDLREVARRTIEAGSDVDMVSGAYATELAELVRDEVVDEELVDDAVRRVLFAKHALGLFEDPYRSFDDDRREQRFLSDDHRTTARDVARQSQVLLQNDEDVLPVDADASVALVGDLADSAVDMLGEWRSLGEPDDVVTVRETLAERVDDLTYAQGYEGKGEVSDGLREEAVAAARDADIVVACIGERWDQTGEAASRAHLDLPGDQRELLRALVDTGTPVAAVLFNGRPMAIDWEAEHLPAILEAWFPGVEAGPAVADVLLGDADPGGRLPMSFPVTVGQVPVYYNQLNTGRPAEGSDVSLDHPPADDAEKYISRYLDIPNAPLYAFGHGESYTEFAYADWTVDESEIAPSESVTVSGSVENVGDRPGREVVQLYVRDRVGSRARPVKELKGFETLSLESGETASVSFELGTEDLAFWTADEEWRAEPGAFDVMVGRASDDVVFTDAFELVD